MMKSSGSLLLGFFEGGIFCRGDYFFACQLFLFYLQVGEVDVKRLSCGGTRRCLWPVGAPF